ncbi:MAG: hypothetical protein IPK80_02875 [Nannocystis sp.]|nr:hypothetical protein [Nannocystis sp.]
MTSVTVTKVGASKTVETVGAVDASVLVDGVSYEVTLCPRQYDGQLDMWGDIDHWISGQRDPRDLSSETLDEIAATVREAAGRAA